MSKKQREDVHRDIRKIFSILPDNLAEAISGGAIGEFESGAELFTAEMPWIDWQPGGDIGRIVITNLADFSSRELDQAQLSENFSTVIDALREKPPVVGAMALDEKNEVIVWTFTRLQPHAGMVTIILSFAMFSVLVDLFNEGAKLSTKEKLVLFELLGGSTLRASATQANVSVETRRAQLKSASHKLNCSGQIDVIRLLLGQLAHLPQLCDVNRIVDALAERFCNQYLPEGTRLHLVAGEDGEILRWLDSGAPDGEPLLIVHGIMMPLLTMGCARALDLTKYRLITPIRAGYLEPVDAKRLFSEGAVTQRSVAEIAAIIRHLDIGPVRLLAHSFGCLVAMRLANDHADLVRAIDLFSINFGQPDNENIGFIGKLFAGLRNLSAMPGIFRVIAGHYRRAYADPSTVERVLVQMFQKSAADREYIRDARPDPALPQWFSELFQNSILGICEDFHHALVEKHDNLKIDHPMRFHFGEDDGLTSLAKVEEMVGRFPNAQLVRHDGGHLICTTMPSGHMVEIISARM